MLASAHTWRRDVVPMASPGEPAEHTPPTAMTLARRLDWASLLRRVFGQQVTRCPEGDDTLCVIAFISNPDVTSRILEHLGVATAIPPIAPAPRATRRRSLRARVRSLKPVAERDDSTRP